MSRSALLFAPITVRGVEVRNRLWVSPMCQYSAVEGIPQLWHLLHLVPFARGGAGLIIAEATAVSPEGRISPEDTGLWSVAQAEAWKPIVTEVQSHGAVAGVQLSHAGRKASTWSLLRAEQRGTIFADDGGWQTVAPSAIPFEGFAPPQELDEAGIDKVVADFASAATHALAAGFEVLEIHAAHGYLLHEFLSPLSNSRTDEYGGSLENRARLLLLVLTAVRNAAPDTPLFVRFSASDWAAGGWTVSDTETVAGWAAEAGADLFDISSGGLTADQQIDIGPGYQTGFAETVRKSSDKLVGSVGLITNAIQAESILRSGQADVVLAGREWLRDPHFALRAAEVLGISIPYWPVQYDRARALRS